MQHPVGLFTIKERLIGALDKDSNVVNLDVVRDAISQLESASCITREFLEETRLGRTINLLRKTTSDQEVQRKAKKLLKSWRRFIDTNKVGETSSGSVVPGASDPSSPKEADSPASPVVGKSRVPNGVRLGADASSTSSFPISPTVPVSTLRSNGDKVTPKRSPLASCLRKTASPFTASSLAVGSAVGYAQSNCDNTVSPKSALKNASTLSTRSTALVKRVTFDCVERIVSPLSRKLMTSPPRISLRETPIEASTVSASAAASLSSAKPTVANGRKLSPDHFNEDSRKSSVPEKKPKLLIRFSKAPGEVGRNFSCHTQGELKELHGSDVRKSTSASGTASENPAENAALPVESNRKDSSQRKIKRKKVDGEDDEERASHPSISPPNGIRLDSRSANGVATALSSPSLRTPKNKRLKKGNAEENSRASLLVSPSTLSSRAAASTAVEQTLSSSHSLSSAVALSDALTSQCNESNLNNFNNNNQKDSHVKSSSGALTSSLVADSSAVISPSSQHSLSNLHTSYGDPGGGGRESFVAERRGSTSSAETLCGDTVAENYDRFTLGNSQLDPPRPPGYLLDTPTISPESPVVSPKTADEASVTKRKKSAVLSLHQSKDSSKSSPVFKQTPNKLSPSLPSIVQGKNRKVQTTEELMADLKERTATEIEELTRLAKGAVKENSLSHLSSESKVVGGSSPYLSQAKSDLVQKFLETCEPSSSTTPIDGAPRDCGTVGNWTGVSDSARLQQCGSPSDLHLIDNPFKLLPPIDLSVLDWKDDRIDDINSDRKGEDANPDVEGRDRELVGLETIEKLEKEKWSGVNGCYDDTGDWKNWTQCVALSSYAGDDINILPYVDVDG